MRHIIVIFQVTLVAAILGLWLGVDALREGDSLWMLFLYCLPSEFLVATVPHEPVLLLYARTVDPVVVGIVSAAGTVLTEAINYSVIRYFADLPSVQRFTGGRRVQRIVTLFERAPFVALLVAALTPVPFYPFRFLVVLSKYPVALYLAAVAVGRTPRFYLIALFGDAVQIPTVWIVVLFAVLIAAMYVPAAARWIGSRRARRTERHGKPPYEGEYAE